MSSIHADSGKKNNEKTHFSKFFDLFTHMSQDTIIESFMHSSLCLDVLFFEKNIKKVDIFDLSYYQ